MRPMFSTTAARLRIRKIEAAAGFSLFELLILIAMILIIAVVAVPNLLRSRIAGNQASAIGDVRTITAALTSYKIIYADGYPPSFSSLGGTTGATPSCDQSGLLDPALATPPNQKSGYQFSYSGENGSLPTSASGCSLAGFSAFLVTATPLSVGTTGSVSYCSDDPLVIREHAQGKAIRDQAACEHLPPLQ